MKVFTTYMNCIVNKDSVTFCNLFALDSVSFYGVNAMARYNEFIKKYPKAQLTLKDKIMSALFPPTTSILPRTPLKRMDRDAT